MANALIWDWKFKIWFRRREANLAAEMFLRAIGEGEADDWDRWARRGLECEVSADRSWWFLKMKTIGKQWRASRATVSRCVRKKENWEVIEKRLGCVQVEELIEEARDELTLVGKMIGSLHCSVLRCDVIRTLTVLQSYLLLKMQCILCEYGRVLFGVVRLY